MASLTVLTNSADPRGAIVIIGATIDQNSSFTSLLLTDDKPRAEIRCLKSNSLF
jgi:hypothetical protein